MTIVKSRFKPAWWLPGQHLQTLYPALVRRKPLVALRRERLELPDGDFVDLDWLGATGPIVIILHGLTGSSQSSYVQGLLQQIAQRQWRGVVMNFRGCSGEPNRHPESYHSGDTRDLTFLLNTLIAREPETPLLAVGYSLGGNVLLKYLGETQDRHSLQAAAAVCVPLSLAVCATRMDQGFSRLYRNRLINAMRYLITTKKKLKCCDQSALELLHSLGPLDGYKSFWEFDDKVIAKLHNFKNVQDYYQRCSSRQFLKAIQIPTLIIQARNDPFMTDEVIPSIEELSSQVTLEISAHGGHVGFIGGRSCFKPRFWLEQRIPQFLEQQLKLMSYNF